MNDKEMIAKAHEMRASARIERDAFPKIHKFEMAGECLTKAGEKTKALVIDIDCDGFIGLFMVQGQPYTLNAGVDVPDNQRIIKDAAKVSAYLGAMSNIDMTNTDNLRAIGLSAIAEAQAVLDGFFTLLVLSSLSLKEAAV